MREKTYKQGDRVEHVVGAITRVTMGVSVISIFLMIIVQVFFRYVLRKSLGGAEELPIYIMACMVWLATPYVTWKDAHVNIELVTNLFNKKTQIIFRLFGDFVTAASMTVFSVLAVKYVNKIHTYGTVTGGLGIPLWIIHAVIAYGAVMTTFFSFLNAYKNIRRLATWS